MIPANQTALKNLSKILDKVFRDFCSDMNEYQDALNSSGNYNTYGFQSLPHQIQAREKAIKHYNKKNYPIPVY